ncbi:hypothetical protein GE061_010823 [Apolygus lucorum]|uniref:Glucose-6-phosphate isomerase n=1 Tax=Apolygus lucorum TaxID=248454 RepID=A0A6A4KAE6_APOLU|nr:hypothetical protein GE061_010823 [Apolygus lucorum]
MFEDDPNRFKNFSIRLETPSDGSVLIDYSKNRITATLLEELLRLAAKRGVTEARDAMMSGEKVNIVENKPVLHNALRRTDFKIAEGKAIIVDKFNIINECEDFLERMYRFVNAVHSKFWKGCEGKPFSDVVVLGHGGYITASQMVVEALTPFNKGLKMHFVTNVDGSAIAEVLKSVQRCRTLFVIISDDFEDADVIQNAITVKHWFLKWLRKKQMVKHFVAVTSNKPAAKKFGVHPCNVFRYGEYVSECYSVWSTIGLPVALSIGSENFAEFLAGAKFMDFHFKLKPFDKNIPVILAMIGIWYTNFYEAQTHVVLPYDQYLRRFPSYIQFLDMKSNGKSNLGRPYNVANFSTGTVTWGEAGTNGQHSFYQLLHQGTRLAPCDFIIPAISHNPIENNQHHKLLVCNFLAQSEALMKGRSLEEVKKTMKDVPSEQVESLLQHKVFEGNRPSNSIVVKKVTPYTLGLLMAIYEHKAFVQSVVWDVDPFVHPSDEAGKISAAKILASLEDPRKTKLFDQSTNGLIAFIKRKMEPLTWLDYGMLAYEASYDPPIAEIARKGELFNLAALAAIMLFWYIYFSMKY